ncbi:MAG: hypothetical protein ACR2JQ_09050 [Mycobacteriales bacterium]
MTEPPKGVGGSAVGGGAVVDLDIGGSKTHGLRVETDGTERAAYASSANVSSVGTTEAGRQLDVVLGELGREEEVAAVCAGAAGANTPEGERRLGEPLAAPLPRAASLAR